MKMPPAIERVYKRIRGQKKFRLPEHERGPAVGQVNPQWNRGNVIDNNPGPTPRAPNPDDVR